MTEAAHGSAQTAPSLFKDKDERANILAEFGKAANQRSIKAVRFRNALNAFLRGVDRAESAEPPIKILAVDTTEIVAFAEFTAGSAAGFSFQGMVAPASDGDLSNRMEVLDRLIINHLLFPGERKIPGMKPARKTLLLDPYIDEVAIIRGHLEEQAQKAIDKAVSELPSIDPAQLERVKKWLLNQAGSTFADEWARFRTTFIPDWGEALITELAAANLKFGRIEDFIRRSNFVYLRALSAGERSIETVKRDDGTAVIDVARFKLFSERTDVRRRAEEVFDVTLDLFAEIHREREGRPGIAAASERDARALATIAALNCFCEEEKINARVELVTRSPAMHDVIGALPDGRVRVTLRHPLFLPDIYKFDRTQLSPMGDVLQRVDAAIASVIDLSDDRSAEVEARFREAAHGAFDLLESVITAQQELQLPSEAKTQEHRDLVNGVFEALTDGIRRRDDPFARELFRESAGRVQSLAEFAKGRVFAEADTKLKVRLVCLMDSELKVPDGSPVPRPALAVRMVGGDFRRLFHLHSKRAFGLVLGKDSVVATIVSRSGTSPTVRNIAINELFENLKKALSALSEESVHERSIVSNEANGNGKRDDRVFAMDSTLLLCMAFAGKRHFDTAILLASTFLHHEAMHIRKSKRSFKQEEARLHLANRELFLLRHYCERALATEDFFREARRPGDPKGSVGKNLARAQRDLDFAALMSEDVERCLTAANELASSDPTPSGQGLLNDSRLRLAHLGAFIDQFMMVLHEEQQVRTSALDWRARQREATRRRLDTWVVAGLVKEITIEAHAARLRSPGMIADDAPRAQLGRYYGNLEARALQGALLVFAIYMAYPLSRPLHRLWTIDCDVEPERILVFRDWQTWWRRYSELKRFYSLDMRAHPLLECMCNALRAINDEHKQLRSKNGRPPSDESAAAAEKRVGEILSDCRKALALLDRPGQDRAKGFVPRLAAAMSLRLGELMPKSAPTAPDSRRK